MKRLPTRRAPHRGFTLIEVMITVAIVAILASVAYPGYRDYIIRSRLVDATNGMVTMRAEMERYFQDNRTYATRAGIATTPCNRAVATRTFGTAPNTFVITCDGTPSTTAYLLRATGNGAMTNYGFTTGLSPGNPDTRTTRTTVTGWTPPTGNNTCWIVRRGQGCP